MFTGIGGGAGQRVQDGDETVLRHEVGEVDVDLLRIDVVGRDLDRALDDLAGVHDASNFFAAFSWPSFFRTRVRPSVTIRVFVTPAFVHAMVSASNA